jgi:hypothetical protein
MQFSLRTIFIVITATAVYTAIHVALYRVAAMPGLGVTLGFYAATLLPLFVLWVVAAAWVFQHRSELEGFRLVRTALLLCIADKIVGEILTTFGYRLNSTSPGMPWIFTLRMLLHSATQTAAWALVLLAYVRANKARRAESLSPWLPDEPAAPEG